MWADAIVEEGNVAHAIAELRRALGETGRGRALIETVPGHGYRFVGEVTVSAGAAAPASPAAEAGEGWTARLDRARAAVLQGAGGAPVPAHGAIVGRDAELDALRAGFESARAGRGVMLCLAGEAGIGKSALIERFLAEQDHLFQWRQQIRFDEIAAGWRLARGEVDKASAHAIAALDRSKQTLSRKHLAWSRKLLGDIAVHRGRHAEAAREYGIGLRLLEAHPCPLVEWRILAAWASSASLGGASARAGELLSRCSAVKDALAQTLSEDAMRRRFLAGAVPHHQKY